MLSNLSFMFTELDTKMLLSRRHFMTAASFSFFSGSTIPLLHAEESFPAPSSKLARGVNLAGAEFYNKAGGKPGYQYFYPDAEDVDFFLERGFSTFRIPFKWERVQRSLRDPVGTGSDLIDYRMLISSVDMILQKGATCILDMHNYGRRNGVDGKAAFVGSASIPTSSFADFWVGIGKPFQGDPNVWLGLMNEPHGISARDWSVVCQTTMITLRQQGIGNRVLVPGTDWSGAHSWVRSGNATAFESFTDPDSNFLFEVHQYLDQDNSGTAGICTLGAGSRRLEPFQQWCRQRQGRRGFLGEFGAGDPDKPDQAACGLELQHLLNEISKNPDIWAGWTAWGGGRYWGKDYPMRLQPSNPSLPDNGYLRILRKYV